MNKNNSAMIKLSAPQRKNQIRFTSPLSISLKIVLELIVKNVKILLIYFVNKNKMMGLCMWTALECMHVVLATDNFEWRT